MHVTSVLESEGAGQYTCNNRTVSLDVLMGYSVTGMYVVAMVHGGGFGLSGQPHVVASSCHDWWRALR